MDYIAIILLFVFGIGFILAIIFEPLKPLCEWKYDKDKEEIKILT